MKDKLFVVRPGFTENGTTYFCPYSAQVVGFLTYYPRVLDSVDLVELGWDKPRQPLVDLVGEDHQAAPLLVLGDSPVSVPRVTVGETNGHRFVEKTIEILRYLAATRSVPGPH